MTAFQRRPKMSEKNQTRGVLAILLTEGWLGIPDGISTCGERRDLKAAALIVNNDMGSTYNIR